MGQQGTTTRLWARRGSRPAAPRDYRYTWAYLFGAVCPARGVGAGLVLPPANTDAMNLHLAEISHQSPPARTPCSSSTVQAGTRRAARFACPPTSRCCPFRPTAQS